MKNAARIRQSASFSSGRSRQADADRRLKRTGRKRSRPAGLGSAQQAKKRQKCGSDFDRFGQGARTMPCLPLAKTIIMQKTKSRRSTAFLFGARYYMDSFFYGCS